jgi:hypothetical protein
MGQFNAAEILLYLLSKFLFFWPLTIKHTKIGVLGITLNIATTDLDVLIRYPAVGDIKLPLALGITLETFQFVCYLYLNFILFACKINKQANANI